MRIMLFVLSYTIGVLSFFVPSDSKEIYLFGALLYIVILRFLPERKFQNWIIEPLFFSLISSLLIHLFHGYGSNEIIYILFLIALTFLVKGKSDKSHKKEKYGFILLRNVLIAIMTPIAIFMILKLLGVSNQLVEWSVLFYNMWMVYYLLLFKKGKIVILGCQLLILSYLWTYHHELAFMTKVMYVSAWFLLFVQEWGMKKIIKKEV